MIEYIFKLILHTLLRYSQPERGVALGEKCKDCDISWKLTEIEIPTKNLKTTYPITNYGQ